MLYVGYVLEIRLGVNSVIDNVVTSDLIRRSIFFFAYSGLRYTIAIIGGKDLFHCIACTCNCRQCCDVKPNTHVRNRVCVIPLP